VNVNRKVNRREWRKVCARVRAEHRPCHLCGQPIDYRLTYRDPATGKVNKRSFSGDHLIPWTDGGPDTYANCGASHLDCNVRRHHANLSQPWQTITMAQHQQRGTPSETW
jgi:hypothetical protein